MAKKPDYLVSICFTTENDIARELDAIATFNDYCAEHLSYWEFIYVVGESDRSAIKILVNKYASIPNLRILIVRDDVNYYWRRAIMAREAIGDVVVLATFPEINKRELLEFAADSMINEQIIIGKLANGRYRFSFAHRLLNFVSQFKVSERTLKTIVLPRNQLVTVLSHQMAPIELRFEPKRGTQTYTSKEMQLAKAGGETKFKQKFELVVAILSASSSRFLSMFAILSACVSAISILSIFYAVVVILFQDNVQPGWFSTIVNQSGSTAFLSIGLAVMALGIANINNRLHGDVRNETLEEIGNISFSSSIHDFNVETENQIEYVEKS